ncbi:glycosyltransferase family 4 protein [Alteromonas facilis]|uniref:glycosyltransferase family 4 protein n=1 Tax=Alteromonas facilis TaxID=2048004 RepID=UPI000C283E1B|nr:glycosyltransferase family 4 protein [Alteromonas facilis]
MTDSKTKTLLVVSSFAESLVNFRLALMQDAIKDGYIVHACAPDFDPLIEAELQKHGIIPHSIRLSRNGLNPFGDIATLLDIRRLIKQVRPTHTLAYTIKPVIYGCLAARLCKVKHIGALITGLGYAFMQSNTLRQRLVSSIALVLYRAALSGAHRVFFQNPDDRALFLAHKLVKQDKTQVVNGSGIDVQAFSQHPLPDKTVLRFLMIGRLLKDKGIREFAAAAKVIKQRFPQVEFHLVGWLDSNPTSISQRKLDQWIAEQRIIFHGKLADVRPVIKASHVYVLPSYREGTPRTVLEAMAIGRAIITTDAPGCRETIIDGESGFLTKVADVDDLVRAIEHYIEHPELIEAHSNAARKRAETIYDVHKVNQSMLQGLQE